MNYYAKIVAEKLNKKDEKENASVQDKFSYKGCLITILKKSEGKYTFSITQKGREEGSNNVYSTQDEAERKAKREVEEEWANSDEEKDNDIRQVVKDLRRKKLEKEGFDKKTIDYLTKKNEEEKSYYAKIVERKHNASESDIRAMYTKIQELKKKGVTGSNIDKYYAAINARKQAEDFLRKFKETGNKDYKYSAENLIKKAEQLEAEVARSINK